MRQGDSLVDFDLISYHRGFADHDSRAVVYAEKLSYLCTGVDVDASAAMGKFGDHPRNQLYPQLQQKMRDPIGRNRIKSRITSEDLCTGLGGRISCKHGIHILIDPVEDLLKIVEETLGQFFTIAGMQVDIAGQYAR